MDTEYTEDLEGTEMKVKVGLTIKPELLAKIDAARGMVKRSTFIEHLVEIGLQKYSENIASKPKPKPKNFKEA